MDPWYLLHGNGKHFIPFMRKGVQRARDRDVTGGREARHLSRGHPMLT